MGDTGSLALGGTLAGLAITPRRASAAPAGRLFVIITLSVVIQVGSYKLTGKRVFRMAPLQHHFELAGWPKPPSSSASGSSPAFAWPLALASSTSADRPSGAPWLTSGATGTPRNHPANRPGSRSCRRTLRLPKIGDVPVRWSRPLPSPPSSVTVIQDSAGRYGWEAV